METVNVASRIAAQAQLPTPIAQSAALRSQICSAPLQLASALATVVTLASPIDLE